MFEQSILAGHPTGGRWSFVVSLTTQVLLVALAVLVPLIYTNRLSLMETASQLSLPLPPPAAAPPAQAQKQASSTHSTPSSRVFTAPARIPPRAATILDEPSAPALSASGPGVPGGIGTAASGELFGMLSKAAPPPPVKAETHPEAAPAKPIRVGTGVQEAKLVRRVVPSYPPLARQARISGTVLLMGVIARDGTIEDLRVVSGHPLLVKAALDAVRQWVYRPTLLNGQPVEVICPIEVHFTLN